MKTFREYFQALQEATPQSGQPGAMAGTVAAANKGITSQSVTSKPSSQLNTDPNKVTNVVPVGNQSATEPAQGTVKPSDMEEPVPVADVKSGQLAGQTALKDFKAIVPPEGEEVEFKNSQTGQSFKVPKDLFMKNEQIENLKRLSGIIDEGEVVHHDFRPTDPKVLQRFADALRDGIPVGPDDPTHAVINVETGEHAFTNRPRNGNWTHMIPIQDFTEFDNRDDPNFFKDYPEEELVNWDPIYPRKAK